MRSAAEWVPPFDRLVADAGYDSETNHRFRRERPGVDGLIPAKKRRSAVVLATTPSRREMLRRLARVGGGLEARRAHGQRRKAETVKSAAKRGWGDASSAHLEATRRGQALIRGLVHNLNRFLTLGYHA